MLETEDDRRSVSIVSAIAILTSVLILILFLIYILLSSPTKMVRTRSQLENLSKEELFEELITVDDITSKISHLTNRFDDFFEEIWSCFIRFSHYKKLQQIINQESCSVGK